MKLTPLDQTPEAASLFEAAECMITAADATPDATPDTADREPVKLNEASTHTISRRQRRLAKHLVEIENEFGDFDQGIGPDGAHYHPADENPFAEQGLQCRRCVFFEPTDACNIVSGDIEPGGICRFNIIPESLMPGSMLMSDEELEALADSLKDVNTKPPEGAAVAARRALDWRSEFGRGGTPVGIARARDLAARRNLSIETIGRMVSFFARHEGNKKAEGFRQGEKGFPSNGRIAWDLWGGDPGKAWADKIWAQIQRIRKS